MNKAVLKAFSHSLAFVLGFSIIFVVVFGFPAYWISRIVTNYPRQFGWFGGILVIILGLHILLNTWGLSPLRFMLFEKKAHVQSKGGYLSSLLIGITFAAGWTPCLGPILVVILTLAASQPGLAVWMMVAYSLGLAIPFLIVALLIGSAVGFIQRLARHVGTINFISSILLIAVGFVLFFGFMSGTYTLQPAVLFRVALWAGVIALVLTVAIQLARTMAKDEALRRKLLAPALIFAGVLCLAVFFWGTAKLVSLMGSASLNAEEWVANGSVNLGIAFLGGLASFLSPCVLPMVPSYILIIGGLSFDDLKPKKP
jgi:cytochrome c-type biogenesis protein